MWDQEVEVETDVLIRWSGVTGRVLVFHGFDRLRKFLQELKYGTVETVSTPKPKFPQINPKTK